MSRCALLPSRADPITLRLVIEMFNRVWQDEVDKLYVNTNSLIDKEITDFIGKYCSKNPKIVFSATDHSLDHGNSITKMVHQSTEDNIVLIEDDSFIYGKGLVDQYFQAIENGSVDACGSLRWSCSQGIISRARELFGLHDAKYEGGGWYWPCFFFVKRSDLLKTDLDFKGKGWEPGEYIIPLQWASPTIERSDTMVWMSMQLRALGLRFMDFPNPWDITDTTSRWIHTNSLSSFIESQLTDDQNYPLAIRKWPAKSPVVHTELRGEKYLVEKKFSWMTLALNLFWNEFEEIKEFRDLYKKGMEKYAHQFDLDWNKIKNMELTIKRTMGL